MTLYFLPVFQWQFNPKLKNILLRPIYYMSFWRVDILRITTGSDNTNTYSCRATNHSPIFYTIRARFSEDHTILWYIIFRTLMRNAIALAYEYNTSTLFYSDIQRGSINAVHFNGTNHHVLLERKLWIHISCKLLFFVEAKKE